MIAIRTWLNRGDLPLYRELGPENGKGYQEVQQSLDGQKASMVRINERGEVIVSVSVPVQRFRAVHGALMLSTQGDDIDQMVDRRAARHPESVRRRRRRHDRAVAAAGQHHRRTGAAAGRQRRARPPPHQDRAWKSRISPAARDEIGHLSGALRDMTDALYNRIEAIETLRRRCRA